MIILLWVRVCRGTLASHCGLDVHKVASLPPEKSDPRHIGSSLRKRGILVAATPTGPGQSAAVATRPTNAQPAHDSRTSCRVLPISGRSFSVSSIDASNVI